MVRVSAVGIGVRVGDRLHRLAEAEGGEEAMKMKDQPTILRCSFCNKDQNEVRALIAGPTVFICNECVEFCYEIVAGKHDEPSASEEIIPIAWLHWGRLRPHDRGSFRSASVLRVRRDIRQ
jgi:hypothetical protein